MTTAEYKALKSPADVDAGHETRAGSGISRQGGLGDGPPHPLPEGANDERADEGRSAEHGPRVLSVSPHREEDLPLVLVTFGNGIGEFEAMYDHLNTLDQQNPPEFQTLIVARSDVSTVVLRVLSERVRSMPTVHLRKLGKPDSSELRHETGTFFITPDNRGP